MTKKKSVSRMGVVLALMSALCLAAIVMPAVAQADHCAVGDFCVWGNTDYTGDHIANPGGDLSWPCGVSCSPDVDENDDSVKNRNSHKVQVYTSDNWGGALMYCTDAGEVESDIAHDRDNDGSSHREGTSVNCAGGEPHP